VTDRTYQHIMDAVQGAGPLDQSAGAAVERLLAVDSMVVRARPPATEVTAGRRVSAGRGPLPDRRERAGLTLA